MSPRDRKRTPRASLIGLRVGIIEKAAKKCYVNLTDSQVRNVQPSEVRCKKAKRGKRGRMEKDNWLIGTHRGTAATEGRGFRVQDFGEPFASKS